MASYLEDIIELCCTTCKQLGCIVTYDPHINVLQHAPSFRDDGVECELALNDDEFTPELVRHFTQTVHEIDDYTDEEMIFRQYFHFNDAGTDRLNNKIDDKQYKIVALFFERGLLPA